MTNQLVIALFTPRRNIPCGEMILKRPGQGLPAFLLPTANIEPTETPEQAASRAMGQLAQAVPPSAWRLGGKVREDSAYLVTASIPAQAFDLFREKEQVYVAQSELTLCDAWVNPSHYEADFIQVLALAHAALRNK